MRALARAATRSLMALFVVLVRGGGRGGRHRHPEYRSGRAPGQHDRGRRADHRDCDRTSWAGTWTPRTPPAEQAALATQPATRSRLLGSLYTSLLPAVDAELSSLAQLHVGDPPAEHADLQLFVRQWTAVRDLLSLADLTAAPAGGARRPADRRLPAGQRPPGPADPEGTGRRARPTTRRPRRSSARAIGLLFGVGGPRHRDRLSCSCGSGSAASAGTWSPARTRRSSRTPCRSPTTRTRRTGSCSATSSARCPPPRPWC